MIAGPKSTCESLNVVSTSDFVTKTYVCPPIGGFSPDGMAAEMVLPGNLLARNLQSTRLKSLTLTRDVALDARHCQAVDESYI